MFYITPAVTRLLPAKKTVLLSEALVPTKGCPTAAWNTEVTLLKPVPISAEIMRDAGSSLTKMILPYTQLASTKKLVTKAQALAKEIADRRYEIKLAIANARNMKKFCEEFPEFVKHLPEVGESVQNLTLIANLRKMGFDNTVVSKKTV